MPRSRCASARVAARSRSTTRTLTHTAAAASASGGGVARTLMDLDAYDTPDAERQLSARDERLARHLQSRRELIAHSTPAAGFLVAATLLALPATWHGPP